MNICLRIRLKPSNDRGELRLIERDVTKISPKIRLHWDMRRTIIMPITVLMQYANSLAPDQAPTYSKLHVVLIIYSSNKILLFFSSKFYILKEDENLSMTILVTWKLVKAGAVWAN